MRHVMSAVVVPHALGWIWQAAQLFVLWICAAVFGVALKVEPVMWHTPQFLGVPLKTAFR